MEREGGCACGAVRYVATGGPLRVGRATALTCRKRHGGGRATPSRPFRVDKVRIEGRTQVWAGAEHGLAAAVRSAARRCSGRRPTESDGEGSRSILGRGWTRSASSRLEYEVWVKRREPWLPPLNVPQYVENRPAGVPT